MMQEMKGHTKNIKCPKIEISMIYLQLMDHFSAHIQLAKTLITVVENIVDPDQMASNKTI